MKWTFTEKISLDVSLDEFLIYFSVTSFFVKSRTSFQILRFLRLCPNFRYLELSVSIPLTKVIISLAYCPLVNFMHSQFWLA